VPAHVLIAGPPRAGTSSIAAGLQPLLPDVLVVEVLPPGQAAAVVVFVVSAAAPLARSDARLLDAAAAGTDAVCGVVSKIDRHRGWRETLASDRALLAGHRDRYIGMRWLGASAGALDELAIVLREMLDNPAQDARNTLCARETRLENEVRRHRGRTTARRPNAMAARLREARVELSRLTAEQSAGVRTALQVRAAELPRGAVPGFAGYAADRASAAAAAVDTEIARCLADIAGELGLSDPSPGSTVFAGVGAPPHSAGGPEAQLTALLGVGFGAGAAVTMQRFAGFLPISGTPSAVVAGASVATGLAVAWWMVRTRRLLGERAVLQRWSAEVAGRLRGDLEHAVAARLLAAETAWSARLSAEQDARAAAARARRELAEVRARLGRPVLNR